MSAIWNKQDEDLFNNHVQNNNGQINVDSTLGQYLYNYASDEKYTTYLEIGTWNGLGSTKCFIEGFKQRKSNFLFYSLECNTEKHNYAKNLYNIENIHILNEVILNTMPSDIYEVFPEIKENEVYAYWNSIDFQNMKEKPLFLDRKDIPNHFDVLFLDGGEFTTWYEYQKLKDRCNIIIMDDTNVSKCKKIVNELKNDTENWTLIHESNERNGYALFERK